MERLAAVFGRLRAANLKLKASKCQLLQRRVSFLGHVLSEKGIEPDPEKVEMVKSWPTPTCLTEARAFVGLASYYRNHIQSFAELARPLYELTKKGQRFVWSENQEHAFNSLKKCLSNAPVLASPRDEGVYVLDSDASDFALGIVLQQYQDGVLKVIAYGSRALSTAERSYCTTRKELLAVIFGLKKYRKFLLGRHFVIRTDHAALGYLMRTPEPLGQQARWLDLISEFDFQIQHRAGVAHGNSDSMSRRPCEPTSGPSCRQCSRVSRNGNHLRNVTTRQRKREQQDREGTSLQWTAAAESPVEAASMASEHHTDKDETPIKTMDSEVSETEILSLANIRSAQKADPAIEPLLK